MDWSGAARLNDFTQRVMASDFVRKVAETFATRVFLIIIGLITSVIVARTLGPEGRGIFAIAVTLSSIGVQFGNLGLHASNTYYVGQDRTLLPTLTGNSLLVSLGFGGLIALAAWGTFSLRSGLAPVSGLLLGLALVSLPVNLANLLLRNLLLGIHQVRAYNAIELVTRILNVSLIGLIAVFGLISVDLAFAVGLVTALFSTTWALWQLRKHLTTYLRVSWTLLKQHLPYGIKAYLAAFFAYMVLKVDLLIVQYILGAEQVGYYSIAVSMADLIFLLPTVIVTILFPKLSGLQDTDQKWRLAKSASLRTAAITLPLIAVAILLAKPAIELLYGPAFAPAVPAFVWLMPGIYFLGIESVLVQFLASVGLPFSIVLIWFGAFIVNIALNLWLVPLVGIVGASMVATLCYFGVTVLITAVAWRSRRAAA